MSRGALRCSRLKAQDGFYWPVARAPGGVVRLTLAASCAVAFCGHFGAPHDNYTPEVNQV